MIVLVDLTIGVLVLCVAFLIYKAAVQLINTSKKDDK